MDNTPGEDEVVRSLEMDIIFARLHPRERILEDDIISRFGVTRHKSRVVIQTLVQHGFAEHEPRKSATVRSLSTREVMEIYEIRSTLQFRAIARMELPLDETRLAAMEAAHAAHIEAADAGRLEEMFYLNDDLHNAFFDACGNTLLANAIRHYAAATHQIRSRGFVDSAYVAQAQTEHAEIIAAARQGDRARLHDLLEYHTNRPRDRYIASTFPRDP